MLSRVLVGAEELGEHHRALLEEQGRHLGHDEHLRARRGGRRESRRDAKALGTIRSGLNRETHLVAFPVQPVQVGLLPREEAVLYVCRAHRVDACEPTRAGLRTARPNPNGDLPYNTVESLAMGKLVKASSDEAVINVEVDRCIDENSASNHK